MGPAGWQARARVNARGLEGHGYWNARGKTFSQGPGETKPPMLAAGFPNRGKILGSRNWAKPTGIPPASGPGPVWGSTFQVSGLTGRAPFFQGTNQTGENFGVPNRGKVFPLAHLAAFFLLGHPKNFIFLPPGVSGRAKESRASLREARGASPHRGAQPRGAARLNLGQQEENAGSKTCVWAPCEFAERSFSQKGLRTIFPGKKWKGAQKVGGTTPGVVTPTQCFPHLYNPPGPL